ncbi:MAG: universal stress protein [Actinomycetota bacterium]
MSRETDHEPEADIEMSTIVVGVDGSEHAERAIEWCARHAVRLGADVVVVHAVDLPLAGAPGIGYAPLPPLTGEERDDLTAIVRDRWSAALATAGVDSRVEVVDGPAATALKDAARANDAELVVVGRRGRGGFAELLLGSTSHHLSHHLDRPLVIVP